MPITKNQIEQRKNKLGSSDMAAVLGLDPYRSAWDVWAEKTGRLETTEPTAAMEAGNWLEAGVLNYAASALGKLILNQYRVCDGTPLAAHIDALVQETGEPVEAKTTGIYGPVVGAWGESGTDQVPDYVIIQATVHLICTNAETCYVPALIGGRGLEMYHVPRDKDLADIIIEKAVEFWHRHVEKDTPPSDARPSPQILKIIRREPGSTTTIDTELVRQWRAACEAFSAAKKAKEELQNKVIAALGDAEAAECELGTVTYLKQQRREYVVPASEYRVLRFRKRKEI